ncbi:AbrB/MazE/SpoVT family DNA-binding domain-containing protein [Solihabitans fulvus]|uniref:AbrB/MazE/SpoVT family DNA-binding domain-containing protein n=2 Tax=Solihabitans fulvus TaxID=1892852 RepID=A0A5B2WQC3_9PSEU|nr:AbrB/MazE/SpoVT family DNA-binding domain-containing protein [Solihabitans fulvus]
MDSRGRIADHLTLRAMGWVPGTRLNIRETGGLLIIHSDTHGVFSISRQGHLRLPAPVRRWCALAAGDRVLLAADPVHCQLVVHPPAELDAMIAHRHAGLQDGDRG